MYQRFLKRLFDFVLSFFGLIVLSPVFLGIAIVIKSTSKGPVFFRQQRFGKDKKLFTILKFRTMYVEAPKDVPTHLLNDSAKYITKIGAFLRKTSLDELPQIINIFTGKMAIIGPRPALYNQDDLIAERDKYNVNAVRPGLTGWAQILGRDELEIADKAALDGYYVQHLGFVMDAKCFFGTIRQVLRGSGVVEGGTGTLGKGRADSEGVATEPTLESSNPEGEATEARVCDVESADMSGAEGTDEEKREETEPICSSAEEERDEISSVEDSDEADKPAPSAK